MGKAEDEPPTSALPASESEVTDGNAGSRCPRCLLIGGILQPRCILTLVLGAAVLLSVLFLLPPFLRHRGGNGGSDRDPWFTAEIVASFKLQKSVDLLHANIVKLQFDIYEEIGVPNSSVAVISLDPLGGSNWTSVVFGIWPYQETSTIPSTWLSLLRSSFMSLVIQQSTLHLTTSLFGNSSDFEVLKFSGGITIIPLQSVFLLQKTQTFFNFTLNFPINQVQDKLSELKGQMKSGLLLNSNENLYFRLTNLQGSTVAPPTVVQTSIVLAIGNHPPSLPRLKQLAQNIRNSSAGNLGLNHTVFGRVKQIQLSTFLQHSLNSGGSASSPSPAPQPHQDHHHHVHRHRHHRHHYDTHFAPVFPPAPAPVPQNSYQGPAPGCQYGFSSKPKSKEHSAPAIAPLAGPKGEIAPAAGPKGTTGPAAGPKGAAAPVAVPKWAAAPAAVPKRAAAPMAAPKHSPGPAAAPKGSAVTAAAPISSAAPVTAPRRAAAPATASHHFAAPVSAPQTSYPSRAPKGSIAPYTHGSLPAPSPNTSPTSPLPAVSFAHVRPPSGILADNQHHKMPIIAPSPHSSSAPGKCFVHFVIVSLVYFAMS